MTRLINRDELKAAIDSQSVTVVDALGGMYYEQQHLPGALPLVGMDVVEHAASMLPDKDAEIITYCSNVSCPNSQNVADMLTALGYSNIRKYGEGIQDWVEAGLSIESGPYIRPR